MKIPWTFTPLLLTVLLPLGLLSQNCLAEQDQAKRLADLKSKSETSLTKIHNLIGSASCLNDSQCKAIPIGHRACGGPAAYLAYSVVDTDEEKLKLLAKQHTNTEREINRIKQVMSICEMLMPPPVACLNNQCKIK